MTQAKRVPLSAMPKDSMASISNQYPLQVVKPEPQSESASDCKSEPSLIAPSAITTTESASAGDSAPQTTESASQKSTDNSTLEDRLVI